MNVYCVICIGVSLAGDIPKLFIHELTNIYGVVNLAAQTALSSLLPNEKQ